VQMISSLIYSQFAIGYRKGCSTVVENDPHAQIASECHDQSTCWITASGIEALQVCDVARRKGRKSCGDAFIPLSPLLSSGIPCIPQGPATLVFPFSRLVLSDSQS